MPSKLDLTGHRYGTLTVIGYAGMSEGRRKRSMWRCVCDCGKEEVFGQTVIRTKQPPNCSECRKKVWSKHSKTHGMTKSPEYKTWAGMITRCENPNVPEYKMYGGRGIRVCDEWRNSFEAFYAYIGNKPSRKHSIDRIDVNGHYEPGNVRWATPDVQGANTRRNVYLTKDGVTLHASEWSRRLNICLPTLYGRLKRGWSFEECIQGARK